MKRLGILAVLLAGCASQPIEAQLATACNGVAAGYRSAAAYRAQGKLPPSVIATLTQLEPGVQKACDPTSPPADTAAALAAVTAALEQITLANAGVK